MRETVKWATLLAVGIASIMTLIAQVTPGTLLSLFTSDPRGSLTWARATCGS